MHNNDPTPIRFLTVSDISAMNDMASEDLCEARQTKRGISTSWTACKKVRVYILGFSYYTTIKCCSKIDYEIYKWLCTYIGAMNDYSSAVPKTAVVEA